MENFNDLLRMLHLVSPGLTQCHNAFSFRRVRLEQTASLDVKRS